MEMGEQATCFVCHRSIRGTSHLVITKKGAQGTLRALPSPRTPGRCIVCGRGFRGSSNRMNAGSTRYQHKRCPVSKLGLPQIRFHDLRHTYATLARRGGMDIKDLSVRLGHEDVATTMNLYQHIPLDMARESAQNVADYILG